MNIEISIPTFNRRLFLEETLNSIEASYLRLSESQKLSLSVSIRDGGSTDDTHPWFEKNKKKYTTPIFLHRSNAPRTYSQRLLDFLKCSKSDYIWYFGDDDLLEPNALETVFRVLEENPKIGYFCINYSEWNTNFTYLCQSNLVTTKAFQRYNCSDNMAYLGQTLGFLSSTLINRKLGCEAALKFGPITNNWAQAVPALYCAFHSNYFIIEKNIFRQRGGNSSAGSHRTGESWHQIFVLDWIKICDAARIIGYSNNFYSILKLAPILEKNLTSKRILAERLNSIPQPRGLFFIYIKNFWKCPLFYFHVLPGFLIPIWPVFILRYIYRTYSLLFSAYKSKFTIFY